MLPTQFEAANVRHRQIGDHQRGGSVTKSLQRELAIARYAHLIPMSRQAAAQDPRELWLIINDKYALLFFHDGLALQGASYNLPKAKVDGIQSHSGTEPGAVATGARHSTQWFEKTKHAL